jgi:hypothetical protein
MSWVKLFCFLCRNRPVTKIIKLQDKSLAMDSEEGRIFQLYQILSLTELIPEKEWILIFLQVSSSVRLW